MSRYEYLKIWADNFPNRQGAVLDSLIRGSFVVESERGYSLIPSP